jgi:ribosome modulation factor
MRQADQKCREYQEGYAAYWRGISLLDCPYQEGSDESHQWAEGIFGAMAKDDSLFDD